MLDHSHHHSKSFPIKLMSLELPYLEQICHLNVESTEIKPNRRTLLLLHGYLGTTQDFHQFFHLFNNSYNIIACDLRGHGKSDSCTNPDNSISWTISDLATDIYQIVAQIVESNQKVIVVASSLSTAIALQMATNHPEIVETMLLISPTYKFKIPKWINSILFLERILPQKTMHIITSVTSAILIKLSIKDKNPRIRDIRKRGIEHFQQLGWSVHRKIFTEALKYWIVDVSRINHPIFILAGTEDRIIPYDDSLQINHLLTNSAFLTIHSKHQILMTEKKLIVNVLEQWLEDHESILNQKFLCADNFMIKEDISDSKTMMQGLRTG